MIEKEKIENSSVWDSQNGELQCSENKNLQFQCLHWKKPKSRIPMFKENHNPEFQYLEKPKQELNSSVWKDKIQYSKCLEESKY